MAGKQEFIKQDAKSLDSRDLVNANLRYNEFFLNNKDKILPAVAALRAVHEAKDIMTQEEFETAKALCYREHKAIFDKLAEARAPVINALQARKANAEKEIHNPLGARLIDDTLVDSLSPGHEKITRRHFTPGEGRSKSTNLSEDIEF